MNLSLLEVFVFAYVTQTSLAGLKISAPSAALLGSWTPLLFVVYIDLFIVSITVYLRRPTYLCVFR